MDKLFYIDHIDGIKVNYKTLYRDLSLIKSYNKFCKNESYYSVFKHILTSLIIGEEIVLLDHDFSNDEINKLVDSDSLVQQKKINLPNNITYNKILYYIEENKKKWRITLFTSGTTGVPKKISHSFDSLTRFIKIDERRIENIWGFAYNPTHMAGIQVFFQAFLNYNTIVRIFGLDRKSILNSIKTFNVSNISSTPTFYRMLLPSDHVCNSVKHLTSGGEKIDIKTLQELKKMFPYGKIRNIYASTEAGALFSSIGDEFTINPKLKKFIKFEKNELYIHYSLLGKSNSLNLENGWYHTGDIIKITSKKPLMFKFLSRKDEMINTGGYKVNPNEVEEVLREIEYVSDAIVYGKKIVY